MLAAIPNPFDPSNYVEQAIRGFLKVLVSGVTTLLGAIVGWIAGPVTEADLTKPWALDAAGRVLAVAAALGVLWLICTAAAGAVRRGPAGAAEPLGRLLVAGLAMGFLRLWATIGQRVSDALTVWLAPHFKDDLQQVMAALVTWPAAVPTTALMVWWLLALLAFVAVLIIAVQLFLRKFAILLLWALIPFAAVFSIGQQGMTLLKRHALLLTAVLLVKPAMAFVISLLAAPLGDGGQASIDEGMVAVAGLGLAGFAPWILIGLLLRSLPGLTRISRAGDPAAAARRGVAGVLEGPDTVRQIRAKLSSYTAGKEGTRAAWKRAAVAAGVGAASGGAAAAGTAAASGARRAAAPVTNGTRATAAAAATVSANGNGHAPAPQRSPLLVADKAGRGVMDVNRPTPGEPAGLDVNDRAAWRREHLTRDDPTPDLPPVPRRAPNPKENGQ